MNKQPIADDRAASVDNAATAAPYATINPAITRGMKTMTNNTEAFATFGKGNLEALMKSGQIWAAGVQGLTRQAAVAAKTSFDESVAAFKALSTVKSFPEAIALQNTFARTAFEKAAAETNKIAEASIKLTGQTLAPITARVTVAVESFGKAA